MSELEIPSGDTFTSEFKPLEVDDNQMVQMINLFEFDENGEQQSQDQITKNIAEVFISEAKEKYNVPNLTYQSLVTPNSPFLQTLYEKGILPEGSSFREDEEGLISPNEKIIAFLSTANFRESPIISGALDRAGGAIGFTLGAVKGAQLGAKVPGKLKIPASITTGLIGGVLNSEVFETIQQFAFGKPSARLPSQRSKYEAGKTFVDVSSFLSAPYLLPRHIQMGSNQILNNLQKTAKLRFEQLAFANKGRFRDKALESIMKKGKAPLGLRFQAGAERFLQGFIDTSRKSPFLFAATELSSAGGSAVGAGVSEELYPGEVLPRIGFEFGLGVPASIVPHLALTNVFKKSYSVLKDFRTKMKEKDPLTGEKLGFKGALGKSQAADYFKQKKLKTSIDGLLSQLEKYMSDGDINSLLNTLENSFLNLDPNLKKVMGEGSTKQLIELVSKSSGLKSGNPVLLAYEGALNARYDFMGNEVSSKFREATNGLLQMMTILIGTGDDAALKIASEIEYHLMGNTVQAAIDKKVSGLLSAFEKVKGRNAKDNVELSEKLFSLLKNEYKLWRTQEREFYNAVPNYNFDEGFQFKNEAGEVIEDGFSNFLNILLDPDVLPVDRNFGQALMRKNGFSPLLNYANDMRIKLGLPEEGALTVADDAASAAPITNKNIQNSELKLSQLERPSITASYDTYKQTILNKIENETYDGPTDDLSIDRAIIDEIERTIRVDQPLKGQAYNYQNRTKDRKQLVQYVKEKVKLQSLINAERSKRSATEVVSEAADRPDLGPLTLDEMRLARNNALDLARELRGAGKVQLANRADKMAKAILLDIQSISDDKLPALKRANNFSRSGNDVFTRTFVGKILAKDKDGGQTIPIETIVDQLQASNNKTYLRFTQIQDAHDFINANNLRDPDNKFSTMKSYRSTLTNILRNIASNKSIFNEETGAVNSNGLKKWMTKNDALLNIFPALKRDLLNADTANHLLKEAKDETKETTKILESTFNFSKFADVENPSKYISQVINSSQPIKSLNNILNNIKNLKTPDKDLGKYTKKVKTISGELETAENIANKENILKGFKQSILEYVLVGSGSSGANSRFSPSKAYSLLFDDIKTSGGETRQSLAKWMLTSGVANNQEITTYRTLLEQMGKFEAAEASGSLADLGGTDVNALFDFYLRVSGSAIGAKMQRLIPGNVGAGQLVAAEAGSKFMRKLFQEIPESMKLDAMAAIMQDPPALAKLLRAAKDEKAQRGNASWFRKFFEKSGILAKGSGIRRTIPLIQEEVSPEIDALEMINQEDNTQQSSVEPSIQEGIPTTQVASRQPFLSGLNTATAGGGGSSAASAPTDRTKYASLFPNDIISGMIAQQPVTMEYGGEVPNLREAPEVDTLRALTQEELEKASLKYLIDLDKQKKIAMDQFANPLKYLGTGYMDAGSTDAVDLYKQEALAEANRLEVEIKQFGMDRAKALRNYSNYLRTNRPVTMRQSEDIEAGNVVVRNFPQELINFADGGEVQYMRNGGYADSAFGLEGDLAAQQQVQGALDPYDTGSDYSTDVQKALYNPAGIQKGRKTDYIKQMLSMGLANRLQKDKSGRITGIYSNRSPNFMEQAQMDPIGTALKAIVPGAGILELVGGYLNPNKEVYTGYNPEKIKEEEIFNDGNEYNPLLRLANQKLQPAPMKTAASVFSQNPDQYTLNVSGINSLRNR
tara:strand:+ start:2687 stop:7768 length:5082 start_codon:yes stop_codon:yes gene_type:complete